VRISQSFGNFWQRLGLRSQTQTDPPPNILPGIQPVLIAGDASMVGPYFDLLTGIAGFGVISVNTAIGGFFLKANNPGGLWVRWFNAYTPGGATAVQSTIANWIIGPGPVDQPAGGIVNANPSRGQLTARTGSYTQVGSYISTIVVGDMPKLQIGDVKGAPPIVQGILYGPVYVPYGLSLIIEASVTNNGIFGSVYFHELGAVSQA
jgi:hypothetical protein